MIAATNCPSPSRRAMRLMLVASLVCPACGLNKTGPAEVRDLIERYEERRTAESRRYGDVTSQPTNRPHEIARATNASTPAGLAGLIAVALEQNPEILAAADAARGTAQRIAQATALSDPMLTTKTLPTPYQLADGNQYFILGVEQEFQHPGKLERRGRVALAETRMAMEEYRRVRQKVIAELKRTYFELFVTDQSVALNREARDTLSSLLEVARGQLAAGKRDQQDVLRAQVELANLDGELIDLRQRRGSAVAMINALLNRGAPHDVESPPLYDIRRVEPRVEFLLAKAEESNPELARLQRQIDRDEQAVELAKLAYWPEVRVGAEWMYMRPRGAFVPPANPETGMRPPYDRMSEEGSDMWAINAGVNLPIWYDKLAAGVREARQNLSSSRQELNAARNTVAYRVIDALTRIRAQRQLAELFVASIIPQAHQTYDVSLAGYSTGASDFQFVIENWQKWLIYRTQYYRALGDLERSIADLELAVGVSLVELRDDSPAAATPAAAPLPTKENGHGS